MRKRVVTGLLVLVPVGVTFIVLRLLFRLMSGILEPLLTRVTGQLPGPALATISVALLLVLLYVVGALTTNLAGRKLIALGESVIARLQVVKTIYSATKQVVDTLPFSNQHAFKSVVWLDFPHPGLKTIGFVAH